MTSEISQAGKTPPAARKSLPARLLAGALSALSWLGGIWLVALMALICCDVIGRSFFNAPITGVAEIASFSIIGIVSLQLPETILHNRLTRTDLVIAPLGARFPAAAGLLEALFALAGLAVFAVTLGGSIGFLEKSIATSEFYGVQGVFTFPTWPVRLMLVTGLAASALAFTVRIWVSLTAVGRGRADATYAASAQEERS
ncbi:TRAP transporter small permease subunit [Stappia sp.]|jgi:TRAP-type C4-dicarboxylate transport system permease small subunit|uniref:TRAP transporter small permease subunit n=1 Tax=Stappia sp. TaxID=1870903 RepID=UPI003A99BB85